jgi:hypothetical protein
MISCPKKKKKSRKESFNDESTLRKNCREHRHPPCAIVSHDANRVSRSESEIEVVEDRVVPNSQRSALQLNQGPS